MEQEDDCKLMDLEDGKLNAFSLIPDLELQQVGEDPVVIDVTIVNPSSHSRVQVQKTHKHPLRAADKAERINTKNMMFVWPHSTLHLSPLLLRLMVPWRRKQVSLSAGYRSMLRRMNIVVLGILKCMLRWHWVWLCRWLMHG